jgi:hypothetical protein
MNRYGDWLLNVFYWDGLLPLGVLLSPKFVKILLPGRQGALELTFVIVPITAFLLRAWNGRSRWLRGDILNWQAILFSIAILILVFLDAMLVMLYIVNDKPPMEAYWLWAGMYLIYLAFMAIALFPVRRQLSLPQSIDIDRSY